MDGIIEFKNYRFWHKADIVSDYIFDFLENLFPYDILFPELFSVDYFILGENLPVEFQATRLLFPKKGAMKDRIVIAHSYFEQMIEKQVTQNVERFGKCLLFIDSEYVRYLKNELTPKARINYTWFLRLIYENKLNVWGINFEGDTEEYSYNDFKFLLDFSTGGLDSNKFDDKKKLKILLFLLKRHDFTTKEIEGMRKKYDLNKNYRGFRDWLLLERVNKTNRESLYGQIFESLIRVDFVGTVLDFKATKVDRRDLWLLNSMFGFFEVEGHTRGALFKFENKFGLAEFFPTYQKNKEKWDILSRKWINSRTLKRLLTGKLSLDEIDSHFETRRQRQRETIRKIIYQIHNFTDEEIYKFKDEYQEDKNKKVKIFTNWLLDKKNDKRHNQLGYILQYSTRSNEIEQFFDRIENNKNRHLLNALLKFLGILESKGRAGNVKTMFVDKYEIAQIFENYNKNRDFWGSIKGQWMRYHNFWKKVYTKNLSYTLDDYIE